MDTGDKGERQLLSRLRRSDERAWVQFLAEHRDRIYRFCIRMVRNHHAAEDLTQDVFKRAVEFIDTYRGEASLRTWLYSIARNQCITYLTGRSAGRQSDLDETWFADLTDDNPDPERLSASQELSLALESALGELDQAFREVILLREIEGLTYEDIAQVTGVPPNTVKTRIHRARAQLQQRLARFR